MGKFVAKKVHGEGKEDSVEIVITGDKLCGAGHFSNVYVAQLATPMNIMVALKNAWMSKEDDTGGNKKDRTKDMSKEDPSKEEADEKKPKEGKEKRKILDGDCPEIQILCRVNHPHIANLLYHFTKPTEKEVCYSLILEYLPTDVGKLLKNGKKFDLLDTKLYTWQIFCALDYLSSFDIAHLDIKPNNLIIDDDQGLLKLVDFGNAKALKNDEDYLPYQVTRFYRAPELLFGSLRYTCSIDVWAAACVMTELYTGKPLFRAQNAKDQTRLIVDIFGYPTDDEVKAMKVGRPRVKKGTNKGLEKHCTDLPKDMTAILTKIFIYIPKDRLTASGVLAHPFFNALKDYPKRSSGKKCPPLGYCIDEEKLLEERDCEKFFKEAESCDSLPSSPAVSPNPT